MYAGNSKVVGQVTAIDKDQDEMNSVYGQIKYEFVNQTSKYKTLISCWWQIRLINNISRETG